MTLKLFLVNTTKTANEMERSNLTGLANGGKLAKQSE